MGKPLTETATGPEREAVSFSATWIWPQLWIVFSALGFSILALGVYLDNQPYFAWDLAASRDFQSLSSHGFELLMRGVSVAGDSLLWSVSLLLAACLILLAFRARREAAFLVIAV